jgi:hypothetical protein
MIEAADAKKRRRQKFKSRSVTRHAYALVRARLDHGWPVEYLWVDQNSGLLGGCGHVQNDAYFGS